MRLIQSGIRAVSLISTSKLARYVTPRAVQFRSGADGRISAFPCMMVGSWVSGSAWKLITATISPKLQPAAVSVAARFENASRTWPQNSDSDCCRCRCRLGPIRTNHRPSGSRRNSRAPRQARGGWPGRWRCAVSFGTSFGFGLGNPVEKPVTEAATRSVLDFTVESHVNIDASRM